MDKRRIALLAGPILFAFILLLPTPVGMPWTAQITAAIALWIAVWWITEPVEMAVTSLLPLVLLPLAGIAPLKVVSAEYGNEIIFFSWPGFLSAKPSSAGTCTAVSRCAWSYGLVLIRRIRCWVLCWRRRLFPCGFPILPLL